MNELVRKCACAVASNVAFVSVVVEMASRMLVEIASNI